MNLDQEVIYNHILKREWRPVLNYLHTRRIEIRTDASLQQAAAMFEFEFFNKINEYPIKDLEIIIDLETLYLLNHSNYYKLKVENHKALFIQLVKRKSEEDAYHYALHYPEEELCKMVIAKHQKTLNTKKEFELKKNTRVTMKWIEIYNRLFELINNRSDAATYFSGPKFIDVVKEVEPYFPDYTQFIEQRNLQGKSTSRKIFYYDILLGLSDESREKIILRILDIVRPFNPDKIIQIEDILGNKPQKDSVQQNTVNKPNSNNPVVFISYSWDNEVHKQWVLNLANRLSSDGIEVILDRYSLRPGKNLPHFVEESISKAQRIIIVFTPNYRLKADKRDGGVGYEYSIMNADLYKNQTNNEKVIPVLRFGSIEESIPSFMQQFIHLDMRRDENIENSYSDLTREIYNEPSIKKPELGSKPTFD